MAGMFIFEGYFYGKNGPICGIGMERSTAGVKTAADPISGSAVKQNLLYPP